MEVEPEMTRALKTFRRVPRYGHAVGRIMVHESALLNWQRIERMLESDFSGCLGVLQETDYGPYLEGVTVSQEVEDGLQKFLADEYLFLDDIAGGTPVAEMMHIKYDFHNLKVIFQRKYFGESDEEMLSGLGSIDVARAESSVDTPRSGNLSPYWENTIEKIKDTLQRGEIEPSRIDTVADRMYLERRLELARVSGSRFLVNYARAAIDVANLRILLRAREFDKDRDYYTEALADGGRLLKINLIELSGETYDRLAAKLLASRYGRMLDEVLSLEEKRPRLTSLDRSSDEYLLEKLASVSRVSVGPERIVRYIVTRENEVVLIRVILMGKLHGLTPAAIEARLSPAYLSGG